MSDGSSGNAFGEALESMTTNTKQAIGGTIADFTKSAANQVKGTGGVSGSFTPGNPPVGKPANPNVAPNLSGGDLFSPDMLKGSKQQNQGPKPLTQAGQAAASDSAAKTPEEMAKIQQIEQELRQLHQKYYQEFLAKAEGRDRKAQEKQEEKKEEKQEEKMEELQKEEDKKKRDDALLRQQTAAERKGGGIG